MRLTVLFLFVSMTVLGQEADTLQAPSESEWSTKDYSQEDKIFNRSVWTFADNPALAGFDRKLNVSYKFLAQKLAMGYYNEKNFPVLLFQQQHAGLDFAFGNKNKNWGVGLAYSYTNEGNLNYHQLYWMHSYRFILPKNHQILLGHGIGIWQSSLNWDRLVFGDMIDPRYGFVYQTNMLKPSQAKLRGLCLNLGLRYTWKRLSFDYTAQSGPHGLYTQTGFADYHIYHKLKMVYHFYIGDDVTISPEFVAYNNRVNVWRFSPIVTVTYLDAVYGQLGLFELNRMQLKVGYQFKSMFAIEIGASGYIDKYMAQASGMASAEAGIRYQLNRKKK